MPLYAYEAFNKDGLTIQGEFEAKDNTVVVEYLTQRRLTPMSIQEKVTMAKIGNQRFALFGRITPLDRILLVRNLAAAIKAGLSVIEALDILIGDATKRSLRYILTQVKMSVQNGQPLSHAFDTYGKSFPGVFIGMLRAGEVSGRLDDTLDELNIHLTREYNLVRKVKSASIYPILLLVASILVIAFLLLFVLPRLVTVFKKSGVEFPAITQVLVNISTTITAHPIIYATLLGGVFLFFWYFRKTALGRRLFAQLLIETPLVKEVVKKVALARFARTLGGLIASAVPIVEALELSSQAVNHYTYQKAIQKSVQEIKQGLSLAKALSPYPKLFPHLLISLLTVGEKTGTLEHTLKTFADFYEEEVENTLKDLTTFLEPALLIFMGLLIGIIAFSTLLPIYQLVGEFI